MTPLLADEQTGPLTVRVADYIATQRDRYINGAVPLTSEQKAALAGYFSSQLLDESRLLVLDGERLENPDFLAFLHEVGISDVPDLSLADAVTFIDVVVAHRAVDERLLLHELVHVEQYRQLGVTRFAELYVRGFLKGGSYLEIPLERMAYALEERHQSSATVFSVADEVARWVSEDRF